MAQTAGQSYVPPEGDGAADRQSVDGDTPLTDALLDQFSAYYLVTVLAIRALEEARCQHALAETG